MRAEFSDVQASSEPPTRFNNVFVICHIVQQPDTRMRVKLGTATPHDYSTRFIGSHHDRMTASPRTWSPRSIMYFSSEAITNSWSRKSANDPAYRADYNIDGERNDERLG
jgi:hypothetical protein